jgi:hypothetical protein
MLGFIRVRTKKAISMCSEYELDEGHWTTRITSVACTLHFYLVNCYSFKIQTERRNVLSQRSQE